MKIGLKNGVFPILPKKFRETSVSRDEGIRIESGIPSVRYTLIKDTVVIEDRSWGGLLTVDLKMVDSFIKELSGIRDCYKN